MFPHNLLVVKILETSASETLYVYRPCCKTYIIWQFVWNIRNTKQKEIETIDHDKMTKTYVAEILQNKICCDKFIHLKTSINEVLWNKMFSSGSMRCTI